MRLGDLTWANLVFDPFGSLVVRGSRVYLRGLAKIIEYYLLLASPNEAT